MGGMALEAGLFPQDLFGYNSKDLYNLIGGSWSCDFDPEDQEIKKVPSDILENQTENCYYAANWNSSSNASSSIVPHLDDQWGPNSSFLEPDNIATAVDTSPTMSTRPKRRRSKSKKNKEEIENQRMTHIAVERNRRKQMNEYLSVLRQLMPDSYVPRGDQASIIGGAINYVKELEQCLHSLVGHKHVSQKFEAVGPSSALAEFFTFPQYSTSAIHGENLAAMNDLMAQHQSAIADIEVTMVENHANLKIRAKRWPKQLLKMVSGLQNLRLTVLHLNVTTVDQIVLYSLSVKVEDDCKLTSVDEIATAVNQMLGRIQEEALLI